jgi:hypothetical protein
MGSDCCVLPMQRTRKGTALKRGEEQIQDRRQGIGPAVGGSEVRPLVTEPSSVAHGESSPRNARCDLACMVAGTLPTGPRYGDRAREASGVFPILGAFFPIFRNRIKG